MRTAHAIFRILVAKHRFSLLSFKRGSTDSTNSHWSIKAGHLRAKSRKCSIPHEVVEKKTRTTAIFRKRIIIRFSTCNNSNQLKYYFVDLPTELKVISLLNVKMKRIDR